MVKVVKVEVEVIVQVDVRARGTLNSNRDE